MIEGSAVVIEPGHWRKSSYSGSNTNCVEIAHHCGQVNLRDSKNATGPTLAVPATHWTTFLTTL